MLVLARRLNEKIVLPTLDITIQVVGLHGNLVRLGIDAPRKVAVFREEIYAPPVPVPPSGDAAAAPSMVNHNVRNRLNNVGLGLALLQRQLPAELSPDVQKTLEQLTTHFAGLKNQVQKLLEDNTAHDRAAQLTS